MQTRNLISFTDYCHKDGCQNKRTVEAKGRGLNSTAYYCPKHDEEYLRAEGAANQRAADAAKRAKETAVASKEQLEQKIKELEKEMDNLKSW